MYFNIFQALMAYVILNELNWKNSYILKLLAAFRVLYVCKICNYNKQSQVYGSFILCFKKINLAWLYKISNYVYVFIFPLLKMILKSLTRAVPSYIVVSLFVFFLWLIFAVMGTAIFSKKMLHCFAKSNEDLGAMSEYSCNSLNGTFHSVPINFDSVGQSYIALLQVVC